jgi:hypothetical protein
VAHRLCSNANLRLKKGTLNIGLGVTAGFILDVLLFPLAQVLGYLLLTLAACRPNCLYTFAVHLRLLYCSHDLLRISRRAVQLVQKI